tara:strand:+ start:400 stop:717 length:318 start_codon:yes stop_codon:yes gene_type:complete
MARDISNDTYEIVLFQTFQKIIGGTNVEMTRLRNYELNILSEVLLTVREKTEKNQPLTIREVELLEKMLTGTYKSLDKIKTVIADTETSAITDLNKSELKNKEKA